MLFIADNGKAPLQGLVRALTKNLPQPLLGLMGRVSPMKTAVAHYRLMPFLNLTRTVCCVLLCRAFQPLKLIAHVLIHRPHPLIGLLTHPLQRYLVDHHTMGRIAGDSEVVAMREALRAGNFRYFVAHSATVYASDTPAPIAVQRDRLVREQLGGVLVYADADRQIYRFW